MNCSDGALREGHGRDGVLSLEPMRIINSRDIYQFLVERSSHRFDTLSQRYILARPSSFSSSSLIAVSSKSLKWRHMIVLEGYRKQIS